MSGRAESVAPATVAQVLLSRYRDVFAVPGAWRFSLAGFFARTPLSTYGLGFVLLVSATSGSYGLAGAVTAVAGVTQAFVSPVSSWLVDRFGQARVLFPVTAANALAVGLLVLAAQRRAHAAVLLLLGALVGATMISVGSLVRARWRHLLGTGERLHTAFALESVVDELVFVIGPLVVALVAVHVDPAAGPLLFAAIALLGATWLAHQRGTEPPPDVEAHAAGGSALKVPAVRVVALVFLAAGGIFGSAEVIAVAFTDERGVPAAAGYVLGAFALGSMLSGLAYGARTWRSPPELRFLVSTLLLTAGTVPFAFVRSVPVLGVAMFFAGLAISPMIVSGFGLVESAVPTARLTEGLTVAGNTIGLGAAFGAAVAGPVIDAHDASRAFLVTVGCAAGGALAVLATGRALRRAAPAAGRPERAAWDAPHA